MRKLITWFLNLRWLTLTALFCLMPSSYASDTKNFATGVQGYDLVGYFADNKAEKGTGDHFVVRDGVIYLFESDAHKKLFEANPEKYLPQYGGWCAFGTAVGKKIPSDPLAWKIVDGKLYLNLNEKVQTIWAKDLSAYIKKADVNWQKIKDQDPQ